MHRNEVIKYIEELSVAGLLEEVVTTAKHYYKVITDRD